MTTNTQSALGGIGGGGGSPSGAMQDNLQAVTNQHQWQWSNSRNRRLATRGKLNSERALRVEHDLFAISAFDATMT